MQSDIEPLSKHYPYLAAAFTHMPQATTINHGNNAITAESHDVSQT